MRLSDLGGAGNDEFNMRPLAHAFVPKGSRLHTVNAVARGFCVPGADWTTLRHQTPPNGTRWQMGFGVMRSPVGLAPEAGEGSQCMALMDRPAQAPRTWLQEADAK